MLPGFRFLFTAIVLSMSVLVFGLGAAALLRAAHEEFANIPSRRAPPEPVFAQHGEPPPTLALLRAEPDTAEKAPDNVPAAAAPAEPAADAAPAAEPEKLAALKPEDASPPDAAKPDAPAADAAPPVVEPAPAQTTTPAAADEPKLAAIPEAPPVADAPPVATEPAAEALLPEASAAATRIATLGGPAVTIEEAAPAKSAARPDQSAGGKRAHSAKERKRAARRARAARQVAAQPAADPFSQPTIQRGLR